jgi:hypothetical protein
LPIESDDGVALDVEDLCTTPTILESHVTALLIFLRRSPFV